jgi:hypothetical protein
MWVFDGEEWTQDNGSESSTPKAETSLPRYDQMMPELQVIEIVPVQPRLPQVPLPTV